MSDGRQQQDEALEYFRRNAEGWERKAQGEPEEKVNIIRLRNGYVLDVAKQRGDIEQAVDAGCGTGDLVVELASQGIEAVGIDFADEMIEAAQAKANEEKVDDARFIHGSVFEVDLDDESLDLISANGFIEYISVSELHEFLDLCRGWLRPGGSLVFGSRNRLFNVFSSNAYTRQELEQGTFRPLVEEAITMASGSSLSDLQDLESAPLPSDERSYEATSDIAVSTRHQYTPAQIVQLLGDHGFQARDVYPIHVHGVLPAFQDEHPKVHVSVSRLLQDFARDASSLLPQSSSFMTHAVRTG